MAAPSYTPPDWRANTGPDPDPAADELLIASNFDAKMEEFSMIWARATPFQRKRIEWVSFMINAFVADHSEQSDQELKVLLARRLWTVCCYVDNIEPGDRMRWFYEDLDIKLVGGVAVIRPSLRGLSRQGNYEDAEAQNGLPRPQRPVAGQSRIYEMVPERVEPQPYQFRLAVPQPYQFRLAVPQLQLEAAQPQQPVEPQQPQQPMEPQQPAQHSQPQQSESQQVEGRPSLARACKKTDRGNMYLD